MKNHKHSQHKHLTREIFVKQYFLSSYQNSLNYYPFQWVDAMPYAGTIVSIYEMNNTPKYMMNI